MHQVARRYVNSPAFESSAPVGVSVVLLMANALDAEALAIGLKQKNNIEVLVAMTDLEFCLTRCERLRPQLLVIDPRVASDAVTRAIELSLLQKVQHVMVLDDAIREGRLTTLLSHTSVSYYTRQSGLASLVDGIEQIVRTGERAFDPEIRGRLRQHPGGLVFEHPSDRRSVASLTARELEVLTLLATGYSVRRCAEQLGLAESTIDNHKSRLMKKLDIHKIVELTHFAIQQGLIVA